MRVSFRGRLFAAFLIVSLIPLVISSALLLQVFHYRMTATSEREAQEYLDHALSAMDAAAEGFVRVRDALRENATLRAALTGGAVSSTRVYNELFRATEDLRGYANFEIYDADGLFRWSTQSLPRIASLPTGWGALNAAAEGDGETIPFLPCEEGGNGPLLRGAAAICDSHDEIIGYLVIQMYDAHFRALYDGRYGAQNDLLLLSPYWHGVYATEAGLADTLAPQLRERLMSGATLNAADELFFYTVARQESTGFYLVLRQPEVLTQNTMRVLYTVTAFSALICVLISILMSFTYSQQISEPIRRLEGAFSRVELGDLDARVDNAGAESDELSRLGTQFNGMVEALSRNQEALLENQRALDETQIRMLQAQLNPHFLGNTLDTMKWISKINKVPQVATMSADLADILRFGISPDELVPLRRETEILERYIEIQRIRLSDGFTFTLDLPAELEDCVVPKMILQPLAENAILHGLEGVENGAVAVTAESDGETLRIRVADNGRGFPDGMTGAYRERNETLARGHLGLYNVDMILRKYYGEGSGLYLENPKAGGAVVTAVLPLRREEAEEEC